MYKGQSFKNFSFVSLSHNDKIYGKYPFLDKIKILFPCSFTATALFIHVIKCKFQNIPQ